MKRLFDHSDCQSCGSSGQKALREEGQSLVEAAILVPILLLLLAAIVDAGRAFDVFIILTNAAREGARFASLEYPIPADAIKQIVYEDVVGSGTNITAMEEFTITNIVLISDTNSVTVTLWYDFDLWFGGVVGVQTFHLEKSAVMRRGK
jgi:Flp pilus assembly protein TadG